MRKLSLLLSLLFALPLFAQEATILGTVTDHSGAVVPGVTITVTNTKTGQSRALTTNDAGQYVASALVIGTYDVKAESKGFATATTAGVVLNVGDRDRIDFSLKVGGGQESVTVEANAIAIKTDTGEVSSVITGEQITQLETNGRSLYSLVNLTPGASSLQADFQVPTPMGGDQNVAFNGQRVAHNLYVIDGAEAADRGGSGSIVMPSIDALAEFQQLTSNYSAEYGLSSAATVTTVLKSGTKQLHASGWWFDRNDFFNARNYFNPRYNANGTQNAMPKLRFNLWGFNVGGPVEFKRGGNPKTFFFYNMEWRRLITKGSIRTNVPFADTYPGANGADLTDAINFSTAHPTSSLFQNAGGGSAGYVRTPCANRISTAEANKFTAANVTLSTCDASGNVTTPAYFANNIIPTSLIDPNAAALLKAGIFPAPTTGNTFIGGPNAPTNVKEELVRIDHTFTDKFSVFGHFIAEQILQTDIPTRWSGGNLPTVWDTFGNPSFSGVVHATYMINKSLLNEAAFNYGGNRINMLPAGVYTLDQTGFSQNKLFGFQTNVTPVISLGGKTGSNYNANWNPWVNAANSYQIRDDLSWTKGAHQLKFGFGWLNFRKLQPLQVSAQGSFTFGGNFTNYDFADFLLGLASGYSEPALKDDRNWNSVSYEAYVQDNWRVNNHLTLNLGLRWDGIPHTGEVNGQMANFYPNLYDPTKLPIFANANGTQICSGVGIPNASCAAASPGLATGPNPQLNGLLQYANGLGVAGVTPGVTDGLVPNHWNNWGPRLGFAYDPTGSGKMVVRGGFGVMYERIQGNDMYQVSTPLFGGSTSISNVSLSNPHVGIDQTNATISSAVLPVTVPSLTVLNSNMYKNPASYQYSLGVQRQLAKETVLSTSYVGNMNRHQSDIQEYNLPPESMLSSFIAGSTAAAQYNTFVPYLGYRAISMEQNEANGMYNSLQVDLRSKVKQVTLQFGYTYSKAKDPTTNNGGDGFDLDRVSNSYVGWKYDMGPSIFDRTHVAFVDFIYDIPFFRASSNKFLKNAIGGWQISGVGTMQTGAPINIGVAGNNICGTIPNCSVRPDLVGAISYPRSATTLSSGNNTIQWFDPAAFARNCINPSAGTSCTATFGDLGKNALRGPGRDNWNLALFKNIYFTERLHFEFRAESYNVFNHTQFKADVVGGGINASVNGTDFGKITSAYDARTFQLGAKMIF